MRQNLAAPYDEVAHVYDRFYRTPDALSENWAVHQMLHQLVVTAIGRGDDILDIGAGTGLFLDFFPWAVSNTTNLDPSAAMLERLQQKHSAARTVLGTHEAVEDLPAMPLVVSLFSSLCYAPKHEVSHCLRRATRRGGSVFVMLAAPGQRHSLILKDAGLEVELSQWSVEEGEALAASLEPVRQAVFMLNRFVCVVAEEVAGG